MSDALNFDAILKSFGMPSHGATVAAEAAVLKICAEQGVDAAVVSRRWGRIVLSCSPRDAEILSPSAADLAQAAISASLGTIARVDVRSAPARRDRRAV